MSADHDSYRPLRAFRALGITVILMSVAVSSTLLNARPFQPAIDSLKVDRSTASIVLNAGAAASQKEDTTLKVVRLGCIDRISEPIVLESPSRFIRLEGEVCGKISQSKRRVFTDSSINNSTNGFEATIFYPTRNSFTSDLISLHSGENQLSVEHELFNGEKFSAQLKVTWAGRAPASF